QKGNPHLAVGKIGRRWGRAIAEQLCIELRHVIAIPHKADKTPARPALFSFSSERLFSHKLRSIKINRVGPSQFRWGTKMRRQIIPEKCELLSARPTAVKVSLLRGRLSPLGQIVAH